MRREVEDEREEDREEGIDVVDGVPRQAVVVLARRISEPVRDAGVHLLVEDDRDPEGEQREDDLGNLFHEGEARPIIAGLREAGKGVAA